VEMLKGKYFVEQRYQKQRRDRLGQRGAMRSAFGPTVESRIQRYDAVEREADERQRHPS